VVDGLCHQLLACAALSFNENCHISRSQLVYHLQNGEQLFTLTYYLAIFMFSAQLFPEAYILLFQLLGAKNVVYISAKPFHINRFGQIVISAFLKSPDCCFNRAVGSNDHHLSMWPLPVDLSQDIYAVQLFHDQVNQHQVKGRRTEQLQGGLPARGLLDLIALVVKGLCQTLANVGLIIHYENSGFLSFHSQRYLLKQEAVLC